MKVTASSIQLDASHTESRRLDVTERLDMWIGDRRTPGSAPQGDAVTLSDAARAAQQADPLDGTDDSVRNDPRLSLLIMLIEKITGRPVRWLQASDLQASPAAATAAAPAVPEAPQRAGYGIEYDYHAEYSESESTVFSAEGTVRTADGRDIRFTLETSMSRRFSTRESTSLRAGDAVLKDPLMLDFTGPAASLSDLRFAFDLDADGTKEQVPLPGGRGMLAFDRNGNGRIDDGRELFGPTTGQGFEELAALDADGNGWLDEADPAFAHLRLWRPDASGVGTLQTLKDANAGAFWLGRVDTPFSLRGADNEVLGQVRASSVYMRDDGSAGTLSQVDLSV